MTTPARDNLTIFVDGDEVPGIIVYGVFALGSGRPVDFPAASWISHPEPSPTLTPETPPIKVLPTMAVSALINTI